VVLASVNTGRPVCSFNNLIECTDHRACHARGLIDQSVNLISRLIVPTTKHDMLWDWPISTLTLKIWGPYRVHLGSQLCSGTVLITRRAQRLINYSGCSAWDLLRSLFDHSLGTVLFSYIWIGLIYNWGVILVFRPCYKAHTSPSSKLGDYIGMMHLSMHLSFGISMKTFLTLALRAYVTYY